MSKLTLLNNDNVRMMFNQSPTPQMIYHPDGKIILTNPALTNLLGYSADELNTMNVQDIIAPLSKDADSLLYLDQAQKPFKIERICNHKDQTPIPTLITIYGFTTPEGEFIANIAQVDDITNLQEWRYHFQLFVHDISLPLSVIYSISSMLVKEDPPLPPETVEEFLNTLYNQSQYARELLHNINNHSTNPIGDNLTQENVQINGFLRQIWEDHRTLAKQKGVNLSYEPLNDDRQYALNPVLMRQALSNLIDNALKYTPSAGKVHLSASVHETDLIIHVCDNGLGIPESDLDKVFDRYFRVKTDEHQAIAGTGLGLSIIKAIVAQHQGRLWVESKLGEGSTFFIALPLPQSD